MKFLVNLFAPLLFFVASGAAALFGAGPAASLGSGLLVAIAAVLTITFLESSPRQGGFDPTFFGDAGVDTPAPAVKHGQMILAMAAEFFDDCPHFAKSLNVLSMEDFLSWPETASCLVLHQRAPLEPDGAYRQLLPYVVVRQRGYDGEMRYLAYQRTSQVGEQRLAGKMSIGIGGHVDATSVHFRSDSTIDLRRTLMKSAIRELQEELVTVDDRGDAADLLLAEGLRSPRYANMFIAGSDGVDRMHLGIVMFLDLPTDVQATTGESELECLGFLGLGELRALMPQMESWSQLLVDHLDVAGVHPQREVFHHPV